MISEYEVTTYTGDVNGAETTSNVYITIYGRKGLSRKTQLRSADKHQFGRASKDRFHVETKDSVFPVSKIRLEHDNTGASPGWFLEKVCSMFAIFYCDLLFVSIAKHMWSNVLHHQNQNSWVCAVYSQH